MKRIIISAVVLFLAAGQLAAEKRVLNFESCMKAAEEKNRDYKIARADLAIAEAQYIKALGEFGPSMSLSAGFSPLYKPSVVEIPAGILGPTPLSVPLATQPSYSMRVSVSQPLFTFGRLFYNYRIADEAYSIASLSHKMAKEKLKLDIISAFYGAIISKDLYRINEESLKRTNDYLNITKQKYESGEASKFDLLRAEVEVANTRPELKKAKTRYDLAMKNLKSSLSIPLDGEVEIEGKAEYEKLEIVYGDIRKAYFENNDERKIAEKLKAINTYKKRMAYANLLPTIGIEGGINYYSYETDFHTEKEYWNTSWDVAIGLKWEFFDSFKNIAEIKLAGAEKEKHDLIEEKTKDRLEMNLENLYSSLNESKDIIEAADKIIEQAEEGYKIAKENYINGLIKSIDLLDAELALMKAKINYLDALYKYTITLQELKNFIE